MREAVIAGALRSPLGRHGGQLAGVRPDDLAAHVLERLVALHGVDPGDVADVFMGCANQAGEDNRDVARMAVLLAGFPETVPGVTVNRLCGSGLEAVAQAARAVMTGDAELAIGAGVESMSRAPYVQPKAERPYATGPVTSFDTTLGWRLVNPRMEALGHTDALGITAETLARERGITRADQDAFALRSHVKAVAARRSGRLAREIVPIDAPHGRRETVTVTEDEGPRADSAIEALAKLRPAFAPEGTVTAGNSSPLNDGAAAVLVCTREYAAAHGLRALAVVRAVATAGVPPRIMGIGPVPATAKALERAGLTLGDLGLIELNEAFAAQSLAVTREWGLADDDPRVNVNGGAIALGHPLGCSGARLVTTLVHELAVRDDVRHALAAMCIGVGQGIAMVLERARRREAGQRVRRWPEAWSTSEPRGELRRVRRRLVSGDEGRRFDVSEGASDVDADLRPTPIATNSPRSTSTAAVQRARNRRRVTLPRNRVNVEPGGSRDDGRRVMRLSARSHPAGADVRRLRTTDSGPAQAASSPTGKPSLPGFITFAGSSARLIWVSVPCAAPSCVAR